MGGYKGFGKSDKHYALYTAEHLKNFIENFRLKLVRIEYQNTKGNLLVQIIRMLLMMVSRRIACPRIKVIAYKI
jgi:uncharacterized protein YdhG (YjbR/CyaY superfamily)